jgi:hypothetical protein
MEEVAAAFPLGTPGGIDTSKLSSFPKTYVDFTSGPISKSLNSGATVMQHLQELDDLAKNIVAVRTPGSADNKAYKNLLETVVSELSSFYGVGSTEGNRDNLRDSLGLGPDSIFGANVRSAIKQQAHAMGDKWDSYHSQWTQASPSDQWSTRMPGDLDDKQKIARASLDPDYRLFDAQAWAQANPQGNVTAAIAQANAQGYGVINAPAQ